jgi:hypothetical protein
LVQAAKEHGMAEDGEWTRKGATMSEVTAQKEYGVSYELIVNGIRAGKIEYREGAAHGNPFLRLLRRQLETYVAAELGAEYLAGRKRRTELKAIDKESTELRKRLAALEARRAELTGGEAAVDGKDRARTRAAR